MADTKEFDSKAKSWAFPLALALLAFFCTTVTGSGLAWINSLSARVTALEVKSGSIETRLIAIDKGLDELKADAKEIKHELRELRK